MRRVKWLIACGIILIPAIGTIRLPASDSTRIGDAGAKFRDKIVAVAMSTSNALDSTLTLHFFKNATIQKIGDRNFIVGTVHLPLSQLSHPMQAWKKGAEVGIPWERVKRYDVYSTEDFSRTIFERLPADD